MSDELKPEEVLELAHGTYSMRDDLANRFLLLQEELNRRQEAKPLTPEELYVVADKWTDQNWHMQPSKDNLMALCRAIHDALPPVRPGVTVEPVSFDQEYALRPGLDDSRVREAYELGQKSVVGHQEVKTLTVGRIHDAIPPCTVNAGDCNDGTLYANKHKIAVAIHAALPPDQSRIIFDLRNEISAADHVIKDQSDMIAELRNSLQFASATIEARANDIAMLYQQNDRLQADRDALMEELAYSLDDTREAYNAEVSSPKTNSRDRRMKAYLETIERREKILLRIKAVQSKPE